MSTPFDQQKQRDEGWFEHRPPGRTGWTVRFRVAKVRGLLRVVELAIAPEVDGIVPSAGVTSSFLARHASPSRLLALVFAESVVPDMATVGRELSVVAARVAIAHDVMAVTGVDALSARTHRWLEARGQPYAEQTVRAVAHRLREAGCLTDGNQLTERGREYVNAVLPGFFDSPR